MGITLDNKKAFEDYLNNIKEQTFPQYVLDELTRLGNEFIKDARTKKSLSDWHRDAKDIITANKLAGGGNLDLSQSGSFNNRTTRLRNSIGYVVSQNGRIVKSDFESYSVSGEADEEGKQLGRQFATEIAEKTQGYSLVCVAGADYAYYVEAKGYDVITGSVLTLKQELVKWSR